jgi:cellulose synthase (UDP-forming)
MLVCIELPREPLDAIKFPVGRKTAMTCNGQALPCTVDSLSLTQAEISLQQPRIGMNAGVGDLLLFSPFPGFDVAGRIDRVDQNRSSFTVSVVAVKERRESEDIHAHPAIVRRKMIQRLYSEMPEAMPGRAYPLAALRALFSRMFQKPSAYSGQTRMAANTVSVRRSRWRPSPGGILASGSRALPAPGQGLLPPAAE